jgi:hypothetical protein
LTEPGAGSDANWKTKAVLSEDGKHTDYRSKNGFQMQVSVAYLSFLHVLVMIKILPVLSLKTIQVMELQ